MNQFQLNIYNKSNISILQLLLIYLLIHY